MRQTAKFLSVLLIGSLAIIPFGEAQNQERDHQNPVRKEQAKGASQDRKQVPGKAQDQGRRQGNAGVNRRSAPGNVQNQARRQGNAVVNRRQDNVNRRQGNTIVNRRQDNVNRRQGNVSINRRSAPAMQNQVRGRQSIIVSGDRRTARRTVERRAHSHYGTLPRWGATIGQRPSAALSIRFGNVSFFYHSGIFYSHYNNAYRVVRPPVGIRIHSLPYGYRSIMMGRRHYYYYYGAFYVRPYGYSGYEVVSPPLGAIVDALPDGYEIRNVNGYEYYYFEGTYYAEVDAPEFPDGIGYQVVEP